MSGPSLSGPSSSSSVNQSGVPGSTSSPGKTQKTEGNPQVEGAAQLALKVSTEAAAAAPAAVGGTHPHAEALGNRDGRGTPPDKKVREDALKLFEKLPMDKRNELGQESCVAFLKDISDADSRGKIIEAVLALPGAQRSSVLEIAVPFLKDPTDGNLPAEGIIERVLSLGNDARMDTLQLYGMLPEDKRNKQSLEICLFCLSYNIDVSDRREIIRAVEALPEAQRSSFLEMAAPLVRHVYHGSDRAKIIKGMAALPEAQRPSILQRMEPFLRGVVSAGSVQAEIIGAVAALPDEQRSSILEMAKPLLSFIVDGAHRARMITGLSEIPEGDRQQAIQKELERLEKNLEEKRSKP